MLIVAGKTMAQRSSVIGLHRGDAAAQFSSNLVGDSSLKRIHVHAGDVVEFRVMTETYYGHFLGVDETITLNGRRLKPVASAAITAD